MSLTVGDRFFPADLSVGYKVLFFVPTYRIFDVSLPVGDKFFSSQMIADLSVGYWA